MELSDLINNLPPELYIQIFDLTFTPDADIRYIKADYKPPRLLHVNRQSRQRFAKLYYGENAIFHTNGANGSRWVKSLPQAHRDMVRKIRFSDNFPTKLRLATNAKDDSGGIETMIHLMQRASGARSLLCTPPGVICISVLCGPRNEERWISSENELIELWSELNQPGLKS
ncbi:hypothetical protein H2203_002423 [Taxawa tesnikishii (nom. ined.)]|nr:hypothetical protein H2203_002423 [Dothideales sp. JES 119]